jgi:hypothetical protein
VLLAAALALPVALLLALTGAPSSVAPVSNAKAEGPEPSAQTDDSVPARNVIMLGSSPGESAGETWGIGEVGTIDSEHWSIVRYTSAGGWTLEQAPRDAEGQPLNAFAPDHTPLTGEITPSGAGALLGTSGSAQKQILLVRDPGGSFEEAPLPQSGEAALAPEESLFGTSRSPLLAALDEGGHAGAFVVPVARAATGAETRVLHWSGAQKKWTSEPIALPKSSEETGGFRVLAIAASSPQNAWLLAQLSSGSPQVALFHRSEERWQEVAPSPLNVATGEPFTVAGAGREPPTSTAQTLTVTEQGVWLGGERTDAATPVTMFFELTGESPLEGHVSASFAPCTQSLPETLPSAHLRSFAWSNPGTPFGERVITGLPEGVSLRLEGETFVRVLSLGGSEAPNDVGGSLGSAFSSAREGWLGNQSLPVHLTTSPAASQLTDYPVPFRHALTAIAPQPGAPVGALSSEALAVGDQGEVARYRPGEGWEPESLLSPSGGVATPRLRAVAWPTSARAFAVGEEGEMWLWRGETGLWESDPAKPINFRGDLLGIAFNPANSSQGYAVGQQGVLLRYGKTWTQETLPPEVAGASFTSIAFAGSEALVAFRLFHAAAPGSPAHYTGGLLVNQGSGWQVDSGAEAALAGAVPWAVAGLPDGGAALSATPGGLPEGSLVLERNGPGAAWQATPPYPGLEAPGSLALFREEGALRAVGSGSVPATLPIDDERPPPVGFPPNLIKPYPIGTGYVVRQRADGWSDEEHERNSAEDPPGEYKFYDLPYQADPTSAILINSSGDEGWAVGGAVDPSSTGTLDTADVARYPSDGKTPPGVGTSQVQSNASDATFAVAGGAQCLAPCSDRANARVGPDVWLSSALEQARQISGMRAFLYTGPRVTSGVGHGDVPVPYAREFSRYAQLLGGPLPAYAVASPSDRGPGNECEFQQAFPSFPWAGPPGEPCPSYYALESPGPGGTVRLIMLDESGEVEATQRIWLAQELTEARALQTPAIVVGNADLNAQIAAGQAAAAEVAQTIVNGGASAYFYDAPEENVQASLRVGARSIPAFGSGTLGYVTGVNAAKQGFIGQMGFLLAQVAVAERNPTTNVAPVSVELIPNIGQLAMEAQDGVLLRRSQAALFEGLARRPLAGGRASRGSTVNESALYIPLPANCIGSQCASGILPEYTFSSSRPDIGDFVEPNLAVGESHAVLLEHEEPVADPKSGLFCAYNAGQTVVTISAGGLSSSLTVTVQPGSVRRPCGTQPLKQTPAHEEASAPAPAPAPAPTPASVAPASSTPPPVPVPAPPLAPAPPAATPAHPHPRISFFVQPAAISPLLPFVPLPVPSPGRPSPPSGTSAVTSPVEMAEHEDEQEEATESVSNQAVAYRSTEHEPTPLYILGIVLLAAFAGASALRRPGRRRRGVHVAPATISTMRAQRQLSRRRRRP